MTQFSVLTAESKTIVDNFFNTQKKRGISSEPNKQLMSSLYSLMQGTDSKVIDILNEYIVSLSDYISEADIETLKTEYPAVVKYCYDYKDFRNIANLKDGNLIVPQTLIDLCIEITKPQAGSSVFVPYSNIGGFAYHMTDCNVDGFEENATNWAISQILLHSQNAVADIQLGNGIVDGTKQYEYILSFPPLLQIWDTERIVETLYSLLTVHLTENGEMCCILPLNFCSDESYWLDVRNKLWELRNQLSTNVVSLPPVLHPLSNIGLCLLHIKRNHRDAVTLMDATGEAFFSRRNCVGGKEYVLNSGAIIEALNSQDEKCVWAGTYGQLTGNMNLQPSRYLVPQILHEPKKDETSVRLSEVIEIVPLDEREEETMQTIRLYHIICAGTYEKLDDQKKEDTFAKYAELKKQGCPLVGINNLSSSYLNCDINRENLKTNGMDSPRVLTSDCLLIGFIGGVFKVGRLHGVSPDAPVALGNAVVPVKIISEFVTEDFFLRCIMSEYAIRQARMLATGATISRINKEDLLSIVINVHNQKEVQDALYKEDARSRLVEADNKILESYEDFRKDMHMKKHAIGQTLFNLNNWWDVLLQARKEGNGILADDAMIGKIRKIPVSSIYDSLQKAINQLQQQISRFDRGNGLVVKNFALTEFIEDYIERKKSPIFDFLYDMFEHYEISTATESVYNEVSAAYRLIESTPMMGNPIEYVEFAPDALEIILDNIVSNACCHGFKDRENYRNLIKIELKSEGYNYEIIVSNNGAAMHSQMKPSEVFVYGKTSKMGLNSDKGETHFGIGGYEIQKLMREFGGDAEIISDPESDFPVAYKLTFYKTNIE